MHGHSLPQTLDIVDGTSENEDEFIQGAVIEKAEKPRPIVESVD